MENGKLFNIDPAWLKRVGDELFVQSGSEPSVWYRIVDGKCECLGYQNRGMCKHIKMLVAEGIIESNDIPDSEMMNGWVSVKVDSLGDIRFATSRYQVKSLGDARVVPVRTSVGWPKFKLSYDLGFSIESVMPDRWMLRLSTNKEYMDSYTAKLERVGIDSILRDIDIVRDASGGRVPILLCYEDIAKKGQWCHRRILSDFLSDHVGPVPELID